MLGNRKSLIAHWVAHRVNVTILGNAFTPAVRFKGKEKSFLCFGEFQCNILYCCLTVVYLSALPKPLKLFLCLPFFYSALSHPSPSRKHKIIATYTISWYSVVPERWLMWRGTIHNSVSRRAGRIFISFLTCSYRRLTLSYFTARNFAVFSCIVFRIECENKLYKSKCLYLR